MAVNAPNPKPLNPSASPYTRAEASVSSPFLPPNSGMIVIPSKVPQLSQEIYGSHPQQLQSQLAWVTRSVPTMVPGFLANPYLSVQHQLTQAWVYQEATACYNIYRQPLTVPYPHLYYSDSENQGTCCTPGENLKESEAVKFEERVKCEDCYSGVLGNVEKRVFGGGARRFVAPPRLRAKRRDSGVFLGEKLWVPKTESKLYGENSGDDQGLSAKEEDGGKDALCNRYKNSVFPCHTNAYLPVVLLPARDGWRQTAPSIVGRRVDPAFPLERGFGFPAPPMDLGLWLVYASGV
ncbi:hypothetical protein POTOM_009893 [Populus tomentosa]|uniref:Uncharacterized protein n=1 Tax=Populus tomentosa TaxID=118781 RepID=A0A8X8DAI8_POPTO|nr:hypothetical protein POTOM_009893 [Populus tomentosa]